MRFKTETAVGLFILAATGIFIYMSYQLGSFRFDKIKYHTFSVYFNDISGLSKKSEVKIAGVKVGFVDAVDLINEGQQVKATVMIDKKYQLYSDAHAVVRQEGLLGSKYLELNPGDPLLPTLPSGSMLTRPSTGPVAVDQMLRQFKGIANNIESITDSMKGAVGGAEGEEKLRALVSNVQQAAERLASFSTSFDRIVTGNEGNINEIFNDLRVVLQDLKNEIPRLSQNLQNNFDTLATSLDRDFNRMANQFEAVGRPLGDVVGKINTGQGVLGQLINDETTARDLRTAINGVKTYFNKIDQIAVIFDIHSEQMFGPLQWLNVKDSKSYANLRIHPSEDYLYIVGLVSAISGRIERTDEYQQWYQNNCDELIPQELVLPDWARLYFAPTQKKQVRTFDKYLFNLQVGKIFGNFAFRGGMFESTGGVAMDIDLPLGSPNFRWVTTFEMFDFRGRNRLRDDRPHFKWLNRMFFTKNIYFTFGADDFISRDNANAFFGMGIRFADDDVKYLLSRANVTF